MKALIALIATLFLFSIGAATAAEKTNTTDAAATSVSHVNGKEAGKLVAKGDVTVVDVRTPSEFEDGHIAGATNIDYTDDKFAAELGKLDRDKTYLVHCASGRRSTSSLAKFKALGFKKVIHLDGGFKAWEAAGNPVEKK
jgi:rhodanese-related sulfurtransferase